METKFTKSTDTHHEVVLESSLLYAVWISGVARVGGYANFEVGTALVGHGAPVEIHGKTESGRDLGKIETIITYNKLIGQFPVPEDVPIAELVYYEAKLPKHGLTGESNRIPAAPPIEVTPLRWSANRVKRGETVGLSADVRNAQEGQEAQITIFQYDDEGLHRKIIKIPAEVRSRQVQLQWEFQYVGNTVNIHTENELTPHERHYQPVKYFFTVTIEDKEFGKGQESGLLEFRDWIKVRLVNCTDRDRYVLYLPDGSRREGRFSSEGILSEDDIPPGKYFFEIVTEEV